MIYYNLFSYIYFLLFYIRFLNQTPKFDYDIIENIKFFYNIL